MAGSITIIGSNNSSRSIDAEIELVVASWYKKLILIFNSYSDINKILTVRITSRSVRLTLKAGMLSRLF